MKKPYDPNLREAMDAINAILKKHDCMGAVILCSKTHSEYVIQPETTWSVCYWERLPVENAPLGLRFRSKLADFPSKEAQHEATEGTVHGIENMRWISARIHDQMSGIIAQLGKHMKIMTNVTHLMGEPDSYPGDGK